MEDATETITVMLSRLRYLEKRDRLLTAMENGGVDNWEGMDFIEQLEDDDDADI
jgi:hypothetical protein